MSSACSETSLSSDSRTGVTLMPSSSATCRTISFWPGRRRLRISERRMAT